MSLQLQISAERDYSSVLQTILAEGNRRFVGGYHKVVFTNGCFDVLHPGHLITLVHARELAGPFGAVVVGINNDESCRRLKGPDRPVMDEMNRAKILVHLKMVDHVVTFEEDTPHMLIKALCPDVIVKGGDYDGKVVVGGDEHEVSIAPYDPTWSTSRLIERIRR